MQITLKKNFTRFVMSGNAVSCCFTFVARPVIPERTRSLTAEELAATEATWDLSRDEENPSGLQCGLARARNRAGKFQKRLPRLGMQVQRYV